MDSLLLNNIITEQRSTPYYGKYMYCARFKLHGASKTRFIKTISEYKSTIAHIQCEMQKYGSYSDRRTNAIEEWFNNIDFHQIEQFLRLKAKWRRNNKKKYVLKMTVDSVSSYLNYTSPLSRAGDIVKLYSNDLLLFDDFKIFSDFNIYQSDHVGNKQIMYFAKEPKTKYRLYFKDCSSVDSLSLRLQLNELLKYNDDLRPSDSLLYWLNMSPSLKYDFVRLKNSYHFGFNEESTFTILQLSLDTNILGKYYELKQR